LKIDPSFVINDFLHGLSDLPMSMPSRRWKAWRSLMTVQKVPSSFKLATDFN